MISLACFFLGVLTVFAIYTISNILSEDRSIRSSVKRALSRSKSKRQTYGFPFSTFDAVKERLPEAPDGLKWEMTIMPDERGELWQTLKLINPFSDNKELDDVSVSLTKFRRGIGRWQANRTRWKSRVNPDYDDDEDFMDWSYYLDKYPGSDDDVTELIVDPLVRAAVDMRAKNMPKYTDAFEHEII